MLIRHAFSFRHRLHTGGSGFAITYGPLASGATETTVTVDWELSVAATGQVHYGTTTAYGNTSTLETSYLTAHSQTLSSLLAGTTYHYKVVSQTEAGETIESADFTFTTQAATGGTYPTPAALAYTAMTATTPPAYLATITDPDYGTEIARISQYALDRPHYSSTAAWNCDGTLFAVSFGAGHEKLYDTTTSPWALLNGSADRFAANMSWSDTNPFQFYRSSTNVERWNVNPTTGAITLDTSWSVGSHSLVQIGGTQGQQAGNMVPYTFVDSGSDGFGVLDISSGTYWEVGPLGADTVDCCYVSQDGTYFVAILYGAPSGGYSEGAWAFTASGLTNGRKITSARGHADFGVLANGNQVLVMCQAASNQSGYFDLDNGDAYTALITYYGGHVSCRNINRPGYAYFSNSNVQAPYNPPPTWAGKNDLFAVDLDDPPLTGTGNVEYYGKAHAHDPRLEYNFDPMMVAHPDGTMVAWGCGWDEASEVHAFVAGLDTGM